MSLCFAEGIVMNPRAHLRMTYESNPIAFLVAQAGGISVDGHEEILKIQHSAVLFLFNLWLDKHTHALVHLSAGRSRKRARESENEKDRECVSNIPAQIPDFFF